VTSWAPTAPDAAIVAGRDNWDHLLTKFAQGREADADKTAADPDRPDWQAKRSREEAHRARALRAFALRLIDDLTQASAHPRRWSEHAAWARDILTRTLGQPKDRQAWPAAETKAAENIERALDRLAALDGVEGPVRLGVFHRTLELELDNDLGRIGRFGEGVLVGSIGMGVGLDLDLVIVLGLAEGTFPARITDDSLLPDQERKAAKGELPLRSQRIERQHREFLATLAGSTRHLLGVPLGDLRKSSDRTPSRWVLDIASELVGESWWSAELKRANKPWIDRVPSYSGGLRRLAFPATEQEHRLRSLMTSGTARLDLSRDPDQVLKGASAVTAARRSFRFTRFDGNLGGLRIPSPADIVTSATRLEKWSVLSTISSKTFLGLPKSKIPKTISTSAPSPREA